MARTIAEIQQQIIDEVQGTPELAAKLTSTSRVAIWRLWTYVVAVCIWTLEVLFDRHKSEIDNIVTNHRAHTPRWYVMKATSFQFGHALVPDTDQYDNTGIDESVVEASKVIKHASTDEMPSGLRIKIAGESGGVMAPVPTPEFVAFQAYMSQVKDAGVRLSYVNQDADSFKATIKIYYNPLVLGADGKRLDGTNDTPVRQAIDQYLERLPFNGLFVMAKFNDAIQAVEGVEFPHVDLAEASSFLSGWVSAMVTYKPEAGWLRIKNPGDLTIIYLPHEPV